MDQYESRLTMHIYQLIYLGKHLKQWLLDCEILLYLLVSQEFLHASYSASVTQLTSHSVAISSRHLNIIGPLPCRLTLHNQPIHAI